MFRVIGRTRKGIAGAGYRGRGHDVDGCTATAANNYNYPIAVVPVFNADFRVIVQTAMPRRQAKYVRP